MKFTDWLKAPWIRLAAWMLVTGVMYGLQQWDAFGLGQAPSWLPIAIGILGQIASHFRMPGRALEQQAALSKRVESLTARIGGATLVALAMTLTGCGFLSSKFPSDVLTIYECVQTEVEAGVTNVGQIAIACKAPEEQLVIDAINSLLDSPKWVADHPQLVRDMVKMGGRQR